MAKVKRVPIEQSEESCDACTVDLSGTDQECGKFIVKKDATVNIGSDGGGKSRIIELKAGEELPSVIERKFFTSLQTEGII